MFSLPLSAGGSVSVESLVTNVGYALWMKPQTPHADDVEFEDSSLPSGWSALGNFESDAISPYAAPTTTAHRRDINERPSHMRIQAGSNGGYNGIQRAYTLPTNLFIWSRLSFNMRVGTTATNNDQTVGLAIGLASGFDSGNYLGMFLNESNANTIQADAWSVGGSTLDSRSGNIINNGPSFAYVGIQKLSSVYHFWAATESGSWMHFGSTTWAGGTLGRILILCLNASATAPAPGIAACDFIRFKESATYLP